MFSIRTKDKKTFSHNLYHYLHMYLSKKGENLFIVHRLDYETSGVMVFAKNGKVKERLQTLFEERKVLRYYEAVVKERPDWCHQDVTMYLLDPGNGAKILVSDKEHGKDAITHIDVMNDIQIGTALKIRIDTGRRNQIRIALSHLGLTLLGDKRYSRNEAKRMYLNSYGLVFPSESGMERLEFLTHPLWILDKGA